MNTGRWADGYSGQAYVYVPAPVYGQPYGHSYSYSHGRGYGYGYDDRHGRYDRYDHGRYGYGHGQYERRPHQGYRDIWGYNDDRHPSARGHGDRRYRRDDRDHRYDRDCGCGDVYLYDR